MKPDNPKIKPLTLLNSAILLVISGLLYYTIVQIPLIPTQVYFTGSLNGRFFAFFKIIGLLAVGIAIFRIIQTGTRVSGQPNISTLSSDDAMATLKSHRMNNHHKLQFTALDILLGLYFIYCLVSYFTIANYSGLSVKLIALILLAILYILVRNISNLTYIVLFLIIVSGIIQAAYGLLQLYGVYPSNHNLYNITGSFFNPGPYAGYLAGIWPIALGIYLFRDKLPKVTISNTFILRSFNGGGLSSKNVAELVEALISKFHVLISNTLKRWPILSKQKHSNTPVTKPTLHSYVLQSNDSMTNDLMTSNQPTNDLMTNDPMTNDQINKFPIHQYTNKLIHNVLYNYLPITCLALMLLALPATRSRAAWLSVIASSGILLLLKSKLKIRLNNYLNTKLKKWLAIGFSVVLVASSAFGLYYFKKGSADGRMVIWKSTALMIKDNPLVGVGFGKYKANYMNYQANYLKGKENSEEAWLAGETNYAYNTILKLTSELGLIGLTLIISTLYFIFTAKPVNKNTQVVLLASKMGLLGVIIFSMFSYPEHILSIKMIFIILLAILSNQSKSLIFKYTNKQIHQFQNAKLQVLNPHNPMTNDLMTNDSMTNTQIHSSYKVPTKEYQYTNKVADPELLSLSKHEALSSKWLLSLSKHKHQLILKTTLLPIIISTIYFTYPIYKKYQTAYDSWTDANYAYQVGLYEDCLEDYKNAYPPLKNNGQFLLNYGKALSMAENHTEAIKILKETENHLKNTIVYTAMGDSYKALRKPIEAENAYDKAWQMIPSRFYAKYLLAKLYHETGQKNKAQKTANEILTKKIKIQSTAVDEIKVEMKKIVLSSQSSDSSPQPSVVCKLPTED